MCLQIGRTEQVENDSNPKFNQTIEVDFEFEQIQTLKLIVNNRPNGSDINSEEDGADEDLGDLVVTLSQVAYFLTR